VEEADGTITKKDFISKMVIARKEAKETSYWLRLIMNKYMTENQVIAVLKECHELINILSSIVNKSR
jgi:four helix bundle protein